MTRHLAIPKLSQGDIDRFWAHVVVGNLDDCWNWSGGLFNDGYGSFWIGGGRNKGGKSYRANRISYNIGHSYDPGEKKVCHKCDNPRCCNPAHLWLGTSQQNTRDMLLKGHKPIGEQVTNTRFTSLDIQNIRESTQSDRQIARRFNVCQSTVSNIRRRKTWCHLPRTDAENKSRNIRSRLAKTRRRRGEEHPQARLTEKQVRLIRKADGTHTAIAKSFGIDRTTVSLIRRHKIWQSVK